MTEGVKVGLKVGSGVAVASGSDTSWTTKTTPAKMAATKMAMTKNVTQSMGPRLRPFPLLLFALAVLRSCVIGSTLRM